MLKDKPSDWNNIPAHRNAPLDVVIQVVGLRRYIVLNYHIKARPYGRFLTTVDQSWMRECANNLVKLQKVWGHEFNFYDAIFQDFSVEYIGSRLPTNEKGYDPWVTEEATRLMKRKLPVGSDDKF